MLLVHPLLLLLHLRAWSEVAAASHSLLVARLVLQRELHRRPDDAYDLAVLCKQGPTKEPEGRQ